MYLKESFNVKWELKTTPTKFVYFSRREEISRFDRWRFKMKCELKDPGKNKVDMKLYCTPEVDLKS